jgi:hypothetical protein
MKNKEKTKKDYGEAAQEYEDAMRRDDNFSQKDMPFVYGYHSNLVSKTKDLAEFIRLLKKIIPFWMNTGRLDSFSTGCMVKTIRDKADKLRGKGTLKIPAIPNDLLGIQDWISNVGNALKDAENTKADIETDPSTREQQWRDDAPGYDGLTTALKMIESKMKVWSLYDFLRTQGNPIRWMQDKYKRKTKVNLEDMKQYNKVLKKSYELGEKVLKQREKKRKIAAENKIDTKTAAEKKWNMTKADWKKGSGF